MKQRVPFQEIKLSVISFQQRLHKTIWHNSRNQRSIDFTTKSAPKNAGVSGTSRRGDGIHLVDNMFAG